MNQLEPCPHCHRHVNVSETACPFCTSSLADAFANRTPRLAPRTRLGRAATFAFGVLALSQGACCDDGTGTPPQDAASIPPDAHPDAGIPQDAAYDGGDTPIYAAAPTRDAGTTSRG
jgi:hypothetical protein